MLFSLWPWCAFLSSLLFLVIPAFFLHSLIFPPFSGIFPLISSSLCVGVAVQKAAPALAWCLFEEMRSSMAECQREKEELRKRLRESNALMIACGEGISIDVAIPNQDTPPSPTLVSSSSSSHTPPTPASSFYILYLFLF